MKFFKTREESHLPSVVMSPNAIILAEFITGEFVTEDPEVIELLIGMGFRHESEVVGAEGTEKAPDAPVGEETEEIGTGAPEGAESAPAGKGGILGMTKAEIAAHALATYGIEISTAQTKDEMLVVLQAAMENAGGN